MKNTTGILLFFVLIIFGCNREKELPFLDPVNWEKRTASISQMDSLITASSYLAVYSEIYQLSGHRTYGLTATISMRNISSTDTIYILKANYYNTKGSLIRSYLKKPIYIEPMETVEVVIGSKDREGGSGANFIFDWAIKKGSLEPLFEAVMISTSGQQGLSFTTNGIKR